MANSRVAWYGKEVMVVVNHATPRALYAIALQIEGQAKLNIQDNGQIDTGFMLNTTYAFADGVDTGYQGDLPGYYPNKDGYDVWRDRVDEAPAPPPGGAGVHCAAEYAIYQEMTKSFLYKALEQIVPKAEGIAGSLFQEEIP